MPLSQLVQVGELNFMHKCWHTRGLWEFTRIDCSLWNSRQCALASSECHSTTQVTDSWFTTLVVKALYLTFLPKLNLVFIKFKFFKQRLFRKNYCRACEQNIIDFCFPSLSCLTPSGIRMLSVLSTTMT